MNRVIKEKWVAALRSGEYVQGTEYLHHIGPSGNEEFCCLGVLCEIAVQEGIIQPAIEYKGVYVYDLNISIGTDFDLLAKEHSRGTQYLPDSVAEWADISHRGGELALESTDDYNEENFVELTEYNDNFGDFEQIAYLIEEQF